MSTKSHVSRWGDSLAVRIPKPVAEQWGVREGSAIEIVPRGDRVILRRDTYDLDAMLADVSPPTSTLRSMRALRRASKRGRPSAATP